MASNITLRKQPLHIEPEPKPPVIILAGGGSGGHITPLLAVADQLKKLSPDAKLIFIGQKGEKLIEAVTKSQAIGKVYKVRAGKFRRYHGEGLKQLLDIKTMAKNFRDIFRVLTGIWQSYWLLKKLKPDVIFLKGSLLAIPVGVAAAILKMPYVTHDSDAVPGIANRTIGRWAAAHAVGLPKEVYNYPADKTFSVGVPVSSKFLPIDESTQSNYKKRLGFKSSDKVLFITGGGNGAQRLNEAAAKAAANLIPANPDLIIIHVTGLDHIMSTNSLYHSLLSKDDLKRVKTTGFLVNDLYVSSGAADVVVTRAGATNIAEFAAQHKACIIVPNPMLTGGHQVKNAEVLVKQKAAVLINDNELTAKPALLAVVAQELLNDKSKRLALGKALGKFAKPRAAKELAELLLDTVT